MLSRRAGVFKNYKNSWCEVAEGCLYYYDLDSTGHKASGQCKGWVRLLGWRVERAPGPEHCIALYNPAYHASSPVTKTKLVESPWDLSLNKTTDNTLPGHMQAYIEENKKKKACDGHSATLIYLLASSEADADDWQVVLERETCNCDGLNGYSIPISADIEMNLGVLMKLRDDYMALCGKMSRDVIASKS